MGVLFRFRCPQCDYEAAVSDGLDRGKMAAVKPMVCNDCNELQNVVVKYFKEYAHKDLPIQPIIPRCRSCNSKNITNWTDKKCPKCMTPMNQGEIELIWD